MRYYSSTAVRTQLSASITSSATSMTVDDVSGFPASTPFTLLIDRDTIAEEIVTVTAVAGQTLTITRGSDGSSATSHDIAADVLHAVTARDLREPQEHIAASQGVHGLTAGSSVVGTLDAQSLVNKSLSGTNNTFTNIPKTAVPSDTVYQFAAQSLTNKTIDGSLNTVSNINAATALTGRAPKANVPADTVYTDDAATLTNKTINTASNTLTVAAGDITSGTISKSRLPSDTQYGTVDTGYTTSSFTLASGWDTSTSRGRLVGKTSQLDIRVQRNGSTLTPNGNGGLTDTKIITVPTAYRPDTTQYAMGSYVPPSSGNYPALCYINPAGEVYVTAITAGTTIPDNTPLSVSFTFLT